jgi:pseudouridine-5'-phosphate glycosidase
MNARALKIHPDVLEALRENKPVVALESTIISHGMPYPENAETARRCEQAVRERGAVPATIAILDGVLHVGLSDDEIERLAKEGLSVWKASRRDLPYLISQKKSGSLTVAATMIACGLAGIRVFATGGIGGVHRGAETTFDVSADLLELAQTDVCVVCAGMKSILDLPKTMEVLETHGVPVVGYQTAELPAFYTRTSGIKLEQRLDSAADIAKLLKAKWDLNLKGGVVVANPIPEAFSYPQEAIDQAIAAAVRKAEDQGIAGKETTPFLLAEIARSTKGKSLQANIALVLNNCRLAADIAVAYAMEA